MQVKQKGRGYVQSVTGLFEYQIIFDLFNVLYKTIQQ